MARAGRVSSAGSNPDVAHARTRHLGRLRRQALPRHLRRERRTGASVSSTGYERAVLDGPRVGPDAAEPGGRRGEAGDGEEGRGVPRGVTEVRGGPRSARASPRPPPRSTSRGALTDTPLPRPGRRLFCRPRGALTSDPDLGLGTPWSREPGWGGHGRE